MIGLGTIVNAAAIIAGGTAGILVKNGLPERYKTTVMQGIGLSVLVIGISGTLRGIFDISQNHIIETQYIMTMIFSLVIGGIIGELLNIEQKMEKLGVWFQNRIDRGKTSQSGSSFAEGFVTASLIYCVGAMAIVGSLEDGLSGNTSTLFAKSILDGVSAIIFSATMGAGVTFSALPVFIYQGSITLLAGFIKPWLTDSVINQMSLAGSVLILAIGINLLEIKKIKVGNMLPAIFLPLIYYVITRLIGF
ncbi:MAG: DUF554 domain-containing protein [Clostridia bacterium]|nr:DUF554 domain-containing protein [Clostridia bacterium]